MSSKLRLTYWYVQAFWQKYKRIVFVSVLVGVLIVWFFPQIISMLPAQQRTSYIGRIGMYTWHDLPRDIQTKISAGLTALDQEGQPIPVLAQRWTVEEDGRAFRFLLKDNLRWQDGQVLKPEDIDYNFTDVQTVTTDDSILFRLQDAYAPFPTVVSQPLFRQLKRKRWGIFTQNVVIGLGEYEVSKLEYRNGYVSTLVISNEQERLIYRFYPAQQDAVTAYRRGEVDVLENIHSLDEFENEELEQTNLKENVGLRRFVSIFFNTSNPDLTREVRQALNYATHKPGPDDQLLRALTPIPPNSWAYNSTDEINPFSYDLNQAVEIYLTVNPQEPLQITLDASISFLPQAQQVAEDWRRLGQAAIDSCNEEDEQESEAGCDRYAIEVQVRSLRDINNFEAALIAREAPVDPDQYSWWHSTQATNISHYQNPRVDKLLEDARKETNLQKRKIMYFEFQKYLVDDVPAIFLFHLPEYTLSRSNLF